MFNVKCVMARDDDSSSGDKPIPHYAFHIPQFKGDVAELAYAQR